MLRFYNILRNCGGFDTRGSQKVISTKFLKIGDQSEESEINFIINYIRKATFLHMLPYARHFSQHVINFEIPSAKNFCPVSQSTRARPL